MFDRSLFDDCVKLTAESDVRKATVSLPASGGVCLFAGAEDRPILLVYGANCRNLVRRRLADDASEQGPRRERLRPITARVWYRRTWSAFETQYAYMRTARAVYPDSYAELIRHPTAWFISIESPGGYRCLTVTDRVTGGLNRYWGPFSTGKSARGCLEILQDLFDLCRCPEILAKAPNATPCAYAQMDRCAAFCDGSASQEYCDALISQAVQCLDRPAESLAAMERRMRASAGERRYEQAQAWKNKAERARKLLGGAFAWIRRLDRFWVLSFQPGPPTRERGQRGRKLTVSAFVIGPGRIEQIEPFALADAAQGCRAVLDHLNLARMQGGQAEMTAAEQELLAWTSRFLHGRSRGKGLYLAAEEGLDVEALAERVTAHFEELSGRAARPIGKSRPDGAGLAEQDTEDNCKSTEQGGI